MKKNNFGNVVGGIGLVSWCPEWGNEGINKGDLGENMRLQGSNWKAVCVLIKSIRIEIVDVG